MTYFRYDNPRDKRLIQLNDSTDDLWELMKLAPQLPNHYFVTYRDDRFLNIDTPNALHRETSKFKDFHQRLADVSGHALFPLWAIAPQGRPYHNHSVLLTTMDLVTLRKHFLFEWKHYPHTAVNIAESIKPVEDIGCLDYIFGKGGKKLSHIQQCFHGTFIPNGPRNKVTPPKPFKHPTGNLKHLAKTNAYRATQTGARNTKQKFSKLTKSC